MAWIDDVRTAQANLATELRVETAQRLTDQAAGRGVKTTYNISGRQVDWNGYLAAITGQLKAMAELIAMEDPYETHVVGY